MVFPFWPDGRFFVGAFAIAWFIGLIALGAALGLAEEVAVATPSGPVRRSFGVPAGLALCAVILVMPVLVRVVRPEPCGGAATNFLSADAVAVSAGGLVLALSWFDAARARPAGALGMRLGVVVMFAGVFLWEVAAAPLGCIGGSLTSFWPGVGVVAILFGLSAVALSRLSVVHSSSAKGHYRSLSVSLVAAAPLLIGVINAAVLAAGQATCVSASVTRNLALALVVVGGAGGFLATILGLAGRMRGERGAASAVLVGGLEVCALGLAIVLANAGWSTACAGPFPAVGG